VHSAASSQEEVHSILHAHLIPKCPHAELFGRMGRNWLSRQPLPEDELMAIERHFRELDRLGEDLGMLDREIAQAAIDNPAVKRLLTVSGINLTVAAGVIAAIGDIKRFASPQKLVSYVGLIPECGNPAWASPSTAGSASMAGHMRAPCWSRRRGPPPRRWGHSMPSFFALEPGAASRSPRWPSPANSWCCAGTC